ncbi:MAG: hypothetical protein IT426_19915 [Pirellulales bacterium]|nr:hypothetical protein [Pirellulales bacterium]
MNRGIAKALVWLAAALMPWDLSFVFACSCDGGTSGNNSSKGCCGTASCTCHQKAKPAKRTCCSGKKATLRTSAARSGKVGDVTCTCRTKNQPQPQTPPNDSRHQKEQLGAVPTSAIAPSAIPPADSACASAAGFAVNPLSALERCGALCRFLI